MIDPAQIPDEVVEAVARLMAHYGVWAGLWDKMVEDDKNLFRARALAALAAGLAAWPGAETWCDNKPARIILPLTQEASDE